MKDLIVTISNMGIHVQDIYDQVENLKATNLQEIMDGKITFSEWARTKEDIRNRAINQILEVLEKNKEDFTNNKEQC